MKVQKVLKNPASDLGDIPVQHLPVQHIPVPHIRVPQIQVLDIQVRHITVLRIRHRYQILEEVIVLVVVIMEWGQAEFRTHKIIQPVIIPADIRLYL